ncbi:MAG: hypothetical protein GJV46_12735 [Geobacter sp.]|nr:hypothetical protein [Geobacter sp.]
MKIKNPPEKIMLTISEIAVTITIWVLTLSGCFFGGRAVLRRRKNNSRKQ